VLLDKPVGVTSHDMVSRVRRLVGTRRVGHAGTLDPAATGVLVLGIGRATRLLGPIAAADKSYRATVRFGLSTTTDDAEGESVRQVDASRLTAADLLAAIPAFQGQIMQRPSAVSAIKVDGRRAYARVRSGEHVELAARPVRVDSIRLTGWQPAGDLVDAEVEVTCGSGTYIRALARDLGQALGVGGHVRALRRTRLGPVPVDDCVELEQFVAEPRVEPLAAAGPRWFDIVPVSCEQAVDLSFGRPVPHESISPAAQVLLTDPGGQVVALAKSKDGMLSPVLVFADPNAVNLGEDGAGK
jgi:tRNA pseudouridine55 synthase